MLSDQLKRLLLIFGHSCYWFNSHWILLQHKCVVQLSRTYVIFQLSLAHVILDDFQFTLCIIPLLVCNLGLFLQPYNIVSQLVLCMVNLVAYLPHFVVHTWLQTVQYANRYFSLNSLFCVFPMSTKVRRRSRGSLRWVHWRLRSYRLFLFRCYDKVVLVKRLEVLKILLFLFLFSPVLLLKLSSLFFKPCFFHSFL